MLVFNSNPDLDDSLFMLPGAVKQIGVERILKRIFGHIKFIGPAEII